MSKREQLDRPEAIQLRVQRLVQGLAHRIRSHRLVGGNTAAPAMTAAGGRASRVPGRAEAPSVARFPAALAAGTVETNVGRRQRASRQRKSARSERASKEPDPCPTLERTQAVCSPSV